MSTLKTINIQHPTSSTTNLTLGGLGQVGVNGGSYGTSGQVLTSQGASAAPTWQTVSSPFGSSTAWASVTRTSGTTYTNSLSTPIMFKVVGGMNLTLTVVVNGVTVHNVLPAYSNYENVEVIVPPGATYSYTNTGVIGTWILS